MKHQQKKILRSQLGTKGLFKRRLHKADLWLLITPIGIAVLGVLTLWLFSSLAVKFSRIYTLLNSHLFEAPFHLLVLPIILLIFVATILYFYIDYQQHVRPLRKEWPSISYPLLHHAKVVALPRMLYGWKRSVCGVVYGVVALLVISSVISVSVVKASGSLASVNTTAATGISPTAARLNGGATSTDSAITATGFQYGTSTSYGSTVVDTLYQISTPAFVRQWGSHGSGAGQFGLVTGVATDSTGNVYAVDRDNRRIEKFDSNGTFISQWGTNGSGDGQFLAPNGIAIDSNNNVYITDTGNNRIQKFDSNGTYLTQWGTYGTGPGEFYFPSNLTVDSSNNVYITESTGGRIQKFDSNGTYLTQWGSSGSGDGQFLGIYGMVTDDSGNVFAADNGNARIQKFDSNGTYLTQWPTTGFTPYGLGRDASGNLYTNSATGMGTSPIYKYDSNGTLITQWQISGEQLTAITISQNGSLYLADAGNYRIQQFSSANELTLRGGATGLSCNTVYHFRAYATNGSGTAYGSDQIFTTAACLLPTVTTGATDSIQTNGAHLNGTTSTYGVTQRGFEYGTSTTYGSSAQDFSAIPSSLSYSTKWGTNGSGDGQFTNASGVAVDSTGNVYIADTGNGRIQKFDAAGAYITQWGATGEGHLTFPYAVALSPDGYVYVADSGLHSVMKFDSNGTYITKWGSSGVADGQFASPHGIAVDLVGNVYVSESSGSRVQKFTPNGTFITKWGTNGSGDGQFSSAQGIALDQAGNIYVVDTGNNRIQKFDSNGTYISQWGIAGSIAGRFNTPWGIAIDGLGNIYVADSLNTRVQKFTSGGTYISQFGSNGTANGQFRYPTGIAADQNGKVYVTETSSSNRIQVFAPQASSVTGRSVSSLTCNTLYHYRTYATNLQGTAYGDDMTFTTSDCPFEVHITTEPPLPDVVWTHHLPEAYSFQMESNTTTENPIGFVIADGALPPGLTMNETGLIEGNPEASPGTYTFWVYAYYGFSYDYKEFSITIPDAPILPPLSFTTPSLANLQIGESYDVQALVKDALPNETLLCLLTSGQLPDGLTLENGTSDNDGNGACRIHGTSTSATTQAFTLQVSDSSNVATKGYTIAVDTSSNGDTGGTTTTPQTPTTVVSGRGGGETSPTTSVDKASPVTNPDTNKTIVPRELEKVQFHSKSSTNYVTALLARLHITPEQLVQTFPWLIIALLFLLLVESLVRVIQEVVVVKKTQRLVQHQQLLNTEKKSLLSLASHYLRTPLTIITGGIELLPKDDGTKQPLLVASQSLKTKINDLISKLDDDKSLQMISEPEQEIRTRVKLWQPRIVAPVLTGLALIVAINLFAIYGVQIHPGRVQVIVQLLSLAVLAAALYMARAGFESKSYLRRYQQNLLVYQQALDHARNEFIHEVTNDLVPAVVAVDTALPAGTPDEATKFIKSGLSQLEGTTQNFILIGQLEKQTLQQHATGILVKSTVEQAVQTIDRPDSLVDVKVPSDTSVQQPEYLLRKMFGSIINNAVEHNNPHTPTEVSSSQGKKSLHLEVSDHGEGIAPERLALLFKPLSRVESAEDFTHQGMGLSLYVSRLIAHYLGGEITAKSELGKGTNMELSIPLQMPK